MKQRVLILIIAFIIGGKLANYRELNELAIVESMGLDKAEDGKYLVSVQVMNSKKGASSAEDSSSQSQITVYKSEGDTIQMALRKIINESPKKLYLAHLNLLVVSEDIAKDGIYETLDFFIRNTDVNNEFTVVLAKDGSRAEDVISILTPIEMNPGKNLYDSIEATSAYIGTTINKNITTIVDECKKKYKDVAIGSVKIVGDEEEGEKTDNIEGSNTKTKVIVSDIAYFKDNKFQGYISKKEAKILNLLDNNLENTIIEANIDKDVVAAFEVIKSSAKYELKIIDEEPTIKINVKVVANLSETTKIYEVLNIEKLNELENSLEEEIKENIDLYLYNIKNKYVSDINGFGDMFYKKYFEKFEKISEKYLEKINFFVNVDVSLENEGSVFIQ